METGHWRHVGGYEEAEKTYFPPHLPGTNSPKVTARSLSLPLTIINASCHSHSAEAVGNWALRVGMASAKLPLYQCHPRQTTRLLLAVLFGYGRLLCNEYIYIPGTRHLACAFSFQQNELRKKKFQLNLRVTCLRQLTLRSGRIQGLSR